VHRHDRVHPVVFLTYFFAYDAHGTVGKIKIRFADGNLMAR
jgi:hypothetical protein